MDKSLMVENLINHFCDGNKARFALILGLRPQSINGWINRNTFDAELIYSKFNEVSAEWLLTGEGEMIKDSHSENISTSANEELIRLRAENDVLREVIGLRKKNMEERKAVG